MSKALALLASAVVASAVPHHTMLGNYEFADFVAEFHKEYPMKDMFMRRDIFNANKKTIMEHNAKGLSWTMNVNAFADLTAEEHSKLHKGLNKALHRDSMRALRTARPEEAALGAYPRAVDWRAKGAVTPVKNQGQCGSCWAFAVTETLESHLAIKTGKQTELSVQSVVSCTKNPKKCGGTGGCGGAIEELGFGYAAQYGVPAAKEYPYTSGDEGVSGDCQSNHTVVATFSGFVKLPSNNYTAMMSVLGNVGPLAITVDASQWQFYNSGVLTPTDYSKVDLDHGVQAVGYGTEDGKDYWIVRNSWGEGWGESGYVRIAREDGSEKYCGTDSTPADGTACDGDNTPQHVCGAFGILFDTSYPTGAALKH